MAWLIQMTGNSGGSGGSESSLGQDLLYSGAILGVFRTLTPFLTTFFHTSEDSPELKYFNGMLLLSSLILTPLGGLVRYNETNEFWKDILGTSVITLMASGLAPLASYLLAPEHLDTVGVTHTLPLMLTSTILAGVAGVVKQHEQGVLNNEE